MNLNSDFIPIITVNISKDNLIDTINKFIDFIKKNQKRRICVIPVNNIIATRRDKNLYKIYNTSDMNLPDGIPLIWASKFLGNPISGRVTGLDLLPQFSKVAAEKGFTFFLLGAKEGVAKKLSEELISKYPALKVLGYYSPPYSDKFSYEENQKIIHMINSLKPNVLWVSLTAPKQDIWIYENFDKLQINIAIGVGGAFEVTAGLIKRAPIWMQKNGLEWFYRFLQEPRRLFKRYFIEAPKFIPLVILQKFGFLKE